MPPDAGASRQWPFSSAPRMPAKQAPESKRGGLHTDRLRVFNAISRDGWEEVPHRREGNVWAFRRRVP